MSAKLCSYHFAFCTIADFSGYILQIVPYPLSHQNTASLSSHSAWTFFLDLQRMININSHNINIRNKFLGLSSTPLYNCRNIMSRNCHIKWMKFYFPLYPFPHCITSLLQNNRVRGERVFFCQCYHHTKFWNYKPSFN